MSLPTSKPLPLRNGPEDKNMCSLNSIIQLLRHIPEFQHQLQDWRSTSTVIDSLLFIIAKQGSKSPVSAVPLRQHLAHVTGRNLNSGEQQDTVELLGYLLNHCPSDLFSIKTLSEYRFDVNGQPSPCPACHQFLPSVTATDTFLRLTMPNSWSNENPQLTLQTLIDRHFRVKHQENRNCSSCNLSMPFMERHRILNHSSYIFLHVLRMGFVRGKTMKNPIAVHLPATVTIDKETYEIVGTITHLGSPEAGHNRAYQKLGSTWFVLEDAKPALQKQPIDNDKEQNYCILLKRCKKQETNKELKECRVLLECLPPSQNYLFLKFIKHQESPPRCKLDRKKD